MSKDWCDIAVRPSGETRRNTTDDEGMAELTQRMKRLRPHVVVMEATGGYETTPAAALGAAQVPIAVVNARQDRRPA